MIPASLIPPNLFLFLIIYGLIVIDCQSQTTAIDTARVYVTLDTPYSSVCQIAVKRRSYKKLWLKRTSFTSTGFLINGRTVLTNAHNLHSNIFSIVESVTVNRARQDDYLPFAAIKLPCRSAVKKHVRSARAYSFFRSAGKRARNDYAVILLPQDISPVHELQLADTTQVSLKGKKLTVIGYPGKTKNSFTNGRRQWQSKGSFEKADGNNIYYDLWTETGNSGSPVMVLLNGKTVVVGIHAFTGKGVRITESVLKEIQQWQDELN